MEAKREEEKETERKKLGDIKLMIVETAEKIQRIEKEFAEDRILHQKKLGNLSTVDASQEVKCAKLNNDIKNLETVLSSRKDDYNCLKKIRDENIEELERVKADTEASKMAFQQKMEELEVNVKEGYVQLQNDKEIQDLLEVGLNSLKDEEQLPFLEEIIRKRKEANVARRQEVSEELAKIEKEQELVEGETKTKQKELVCLKEKYLRLVGELAAKEKSRR